jgi:hypothetical protein
MFHGWAASFESPIFLLPARAWLHYRMPVLVLCVFLRSQIMHAKNDGSDDGQQNDESGKIFDHEMNPLASIYIETLP